MYTRSIFVGWLCGVVERLFGKSNGIAEFYRDIGFIFCYQGCEPRFFEANQFARQRVGRR